ncbi:MAG: hypothetical protein EDM05_041080 [Leptolyngbya sp. IPPAS B-1204]|nr:hypothetical protein [Elainella sp. C42_A2020_010]
MNNFNFNPVEIDCTTSNGKTRNPILNTSIAKSTGLYIQSAQGIYQFSAQDD